MIKGKSTIQLFSAKTGKLEHEEENTNIVTNAIEDILNYNDPYGLGVRRTSTYFPQKSLYPFTTTAFGGVFLWNGNIAEDPSITMPPDGILETGHAGGQYSGQNKYRGTYNANESGSISEDGRRGYRHVWDFGTDKANGTIKCLSLTSALGGDTGYCNYDFRKSGEGSICAYCLGNSFKTNTGSENQPADKTAALPRLDGVPTISTLYEVYEIKEDQNTLKALLHVNVYKNNTYQKEVWEVSIPKIQNRLSLSSYPAYFSAEQKVIIGNTNPLRWGDYYCKMYLYNEKFYMCKVERVTNEETKEYEYYMKILRWSKDGTREDDIDVLLPETPYSYNDVGFYYEGAVYYRTFAETLSRCDLSGNKLTGKIGLWNYNSNASGGWSEIFSIRVMPDGNLNVTFGATGSYGWRGRLIIDKRGGDSVMPVNNYDIYSCNVATPSVKSPFLYRFMLFNYSGIGNILEPMLDVDPRYLATINNLATPVTKTEAQTMKVTYELIEV